jgi:hypothetical protein
VNTQENRRKNINLTSRDSQEGLPVGSEHMSDDSRRSPFQVAKEAREEEGQDRNCTIALLLPSLKSQLPARGEEEEGRRQESGHPSECSPTSTASFSHILFTSLWQHCAQCLHCKWAVSALFHGALD